ncbi:Gypsy retrotransposon integrase-like protein 1 [Marasmius sp. AFHP31]|nr:Gypsy retrotransposon integrase-like protein 1 [Marasmius sp. AFHP31]
MGTDTIIDGAIDGSGKKLRLQNACDECRKKKGVFSSPLPIDKAYRFNFQFDVIVLLQQNKAVAALREAEIENVGGEITVMQSPGTLARFSRRGPKFGVKKDAARALVNEILSTSKPFVVPQDSGKVKDMLVELANHARSLDRQLLLAQGASPEVGPIPNSAPFTYSIDETEAKESDERQEIEDSIDSLTQELGEVTLGQPETHFGKSSHFLLIESAMDARRDVLGGRALITHDVFTKLQRPPFWDLCPWHESLQRPIIPFVYPPHDLLYDLIDLYFRRINPIFPLLHRPTFERIQMCSLCVSYLQGSPKPDRVWLILGNGIRMAQELGMHRRASDKQRETPDYELWKRAFWLLVATDTILCAVLGRPRATQPEDYDVELPVECDDEYWEHPGVSGKRFVQPDGQPSSLSYFLALLRLLEIVGQAQRTLVD